MSAPSKYGELADIAMSAGYGVTNAIVASLREFLRQVCAVLGPKCSLYLLLDQFEVFFNTLKKDERAAAAANRSSVTNAAGIDPEAFVASLGYGGAA